MINKFFKRRRARPSVRVIISDRVKQKLNSFAQKAHPIETGGLLIGWWDCDTINVVDALEVIDSNASGTGWTRQEASSQNVLNSVLQSNPDSNLGYIGDWHSHPAVIGASNTDIVSLTKMSKQYSQPILAIVRLLNNQLDIHAATDGKRCEIIILN